MSENLKVYVSADTTDVEKAEEKTKRSVSRMIAGIRRVAKIGIGISILFGENVDQMMRLGIESALLTIELTTATIAAYQTSNPVFTLRTVAQAGTIIAMWGIMLKMRRQRQKAREESIAMANAYRYLALER